MSSSEITTQSHRPRKGDATGEEMLTEISVAPDGRVFVFGASAAVLEALSAIGLGGQALANRVQQLQQHTRTTVASEQAILTEGGENL